MSKTWFICLTVVVLAAVFSGIAGADVIWNTFPAGDVFPTTSGSAIYSGQTVANQLTVSGKDYVFDQLEIGLGWAFGVNSFYVSLSQDSLGQPGTPLETFNLNAPVTYAAKVTLNSVVHPLLQNGASYWVVASAASANTNGFWPHNTGLTGNRAWSPGTGWTLETGYPDVFRVSGSAVPEPSSLLAMFAGVGCLGGILRRRRG